MNRVGVLALQGAVSEHLRMAARVGCEPVPVTDAATLLGCDALVIPGGESTTISRLIHTRGLARPLCYFAVQKPVLGTCAGMILCAKAVTESGKGPEPLGLMNITVERNGFGRQVNSFETDLSVTGLGSLPAVFIRAPYIKTAGPEVRILAYVKNRAVMAEQGTLLVTAFHPELTDDLNVYRYFTAKIQPA